MSSAPEPGRPSPVLPAPRTVAIALAVDAKESENDYCNDEEFDLLAGGGVDPKAATYEKEDTEIGTSAA